MQMKPYIPLLVIACASAGVPVSHGQDDSPWASKEKTNFTPNVHHPNIKGVTLFAQNPQIVTPVGIAVAPDGRVFVQENHTHKRNSDYEGPEKDRILVFEDKDQDGVAEDRSVFYEGQTFSTDLLFGPEGHLYVSTRWFIGRFPDAADKASANGEPEKLIICETDGDYPHNGVGGLAIDPANPEWLAFGFGENLGADYTFVGSDGVKLSGGAEGGSTYRCRTDGSGLTRQSTGHWNAFGMAYDLSGNLFSTDNDPNAVPPNRLLHIVPGADFGYEYRYGRSGLHPLVCWYGENPGTLGMIGALGEAACGLISHGPEKLLSASWTDNRVDLHSLQPRGDSFNAIREPFLSGPDDFRPVHFAYSADGRYLYFTDWVKLSYPVHGHGRIWRVEFKQPISLEPSSDRPSAPELSTTDAFVKLGSDDAYTRTAAVRALSERPESLASYEWQSEANAIARAHYAVALKRSNATGRTDIIPALLKDDDSEVRFVGIKWVADEKLSQFESNLRGVLNRGDLNRRDLLSVIAALARVGGGSKKEFSPDNALLNLAINEGKPAALRSLALANVKASYPRLTLATLAALAESSAQRIRREAVHALAIHPDPNRSNVLARIAGDESFDANLRADAIAGLAAGGQDHATLLRSLASEANPTIAEEADRTLVAIGLARRKVEEKPPAERVEDWVALLQREATHKPDVAVGRRLFFHSSFAGCYKCHAMHGRGSAVGPDLTNIHKQTGVNQAWLLKHIVNPNAEMAPYYRPQQLLTVDGLVLTGLVVGKEGKKQQYVASDGTTFSVDKDDIEERREMQTSIMPSGLLDAMSVDEIRHLIAYLLSDNERRNERDTVMNADPKEPPIVGNPDFIHLERENDVWWLVDHTGKRFITTGMNHVGEGGVLFNEVNRGWMTGRFGDDIQGSWGGLNPRAKNIGAYADMVVGDFQDYGFNTIPFHAYSTPLNLYEERKIYYVAKIKVQNISLMQMNRAKGDRFPDVFSATFREKLDTVAKRVCRPLRDAKYCLGYTYFDMPDLKPVRRWQRQLFPDGGLVYPWVQDMRELPAAAAGKQAWMRVLKRNHASASDAARAYALDDIDSWEELAKMTTWPIMPADVARVRKDAEDMLVALAEKWYGLHHELIRKYDPNHLLLGDKHDVGYDQWVDAIPDGVLDVIAKYNDVLTVQYYSFYTDLHNATLQELHRKTGLPIINGDHSYAFKTAKHTKIKGLEVESFEAVADEYRRYMKGTMQDHPYMLGWWHCGYIEQWAPAGTKGLGQQCGFFSPFGEPNGELLALVKQANENAPKWHGGESTIDPSQTVRVEPSTPAEMFAALKLTADQQKALDVLESQRVAAEASFRALEGQSMRDAKSKFYTERKRKLRTVFTEGQWAIWSSFWDRASAAGIK
ncbi:MAG: PVC-type heme-binding CxxCH protein [Planctomycetota bacterium]